MIKEVGRSVEIHDVIDREEEESDETKLEFDEEDIMELKLQLDEDDKDDDDDDVEELRKMKNEISDKYVEFEASEICFQIWTTEVNHRMRWGN
ncbi:hypothetical protein Tco_0828106 [Tanacetum coccineum]